MQKIKKYYEAENDSKKGKKSYQERIQQDNEAEQEIIDYLEDTREEEFPEEEGYNYKNDY